MQHWRDYCRKAGIGEILVVSALVRGNNDYEQYGFDAGVEFPPHNVKFNGVNEILPTYEKFNGYAIEYANVARDFLSRDHRDRLVFRTVFPDWDNTARVKDRALIVLGSTVSNYERWLRGASSLTVAERRPDEQLVFINAWNEWAEGCYLEPDFRHGTGFLDATKRVKDGKSLVDDIYDEAPERTRYNLSRKQAPSVAEVAPLLTIPEPGTIKVPLKFRIAHFLHDKPRAFKAAQLAYRAGKHVAAPFRGKARAIEPQNQDATGRTEFAERQLEEVALDTLTNISANKSDFMSSLDDTIWLAYPQTRVRWKHEPELIFAKDTRNGPTLKEMRSENSFDAYPMLFGQFFNCIAHPRAVALIDANGRLIAETARIYKYLSPKSIDLDYLEFRENGPVQTKPAKTFIDADVLIPLHGSEAFGHVIFDAIPQILAFEEEIKAGQIKVLMREQMFTWYARILQTWGLHPHHFLVLPAKNESSYRFRSAIVSNALTTFSTFFPNPGTIERYRQSLTSLPKPPAAEHRRLVYLNRLPGTTHSGRTITNENELQKMLVRRGFHVVDPATLAFAEQVQLFTQADVIVGAHGSAFANLIWCRPGARVVDLMPDDWVNFWGSDAGVTEYWVARICALMDLQYSVVLCESPGSSAKWSAENGDYAMKSVVDVKLLDRKMDSILNDIGLNDIGAHRSRGRSAKPRARNNRGL